NAVVLIQQNYFVNPLYMKLQVWLTLDYDKQSQNPYFAFSHFRTIVTMSSRPVFFCTLDDYTGRQG
ncbi:hypothetical protein L9F63_004298, partial [Diploptera punctata]